MLRLSLTVPLGFVSVGLADLDLGFRFGKRRIGPFSITSRVCGLALDAGNRPSNKSPLLLAKPDGHNSQLWYLERASEKGHVLIRSADTPLVVDSTTELHGDIHPLLWEGHGEQWQQWRLEKAPTPGSYRIEGLHIGKFLSSNEDATPGWSPWFEPGKDSIRQEWMMSLRSVDGVAPRQQRRP